MHLLPPSTPRWLLALVAFGGLSLHAASGASPYRIEVVEKGSGWPVPLVELKTVSETRFLSDNAGIIAFDLPECMGRETWFSVSSPNYEVPKDGLGSRGFRCVPTPGGKYHLEVTRTGPAKRLGRLTGSGLYGESQKLDEQLDWKESGVVGCDTIEMATYQGKLFWAWGDTNLFKYPLGIYHTTSATTSLHPLTSYEPPLKVVYDYFRAKDEVPREVFPVPSSEPVWISAPVTLPDADGKEHLVSFYRRIVNHLDTAEAGLAEWDDASANYKSVLVLWKKGEPRRDPPVPGGHAALWRDPAGKNWAYFGEGLPKLRCPATYEDWKNPDTWEKVEAPGFLTASDGEKVSIAAGSVAWNPWRKRWVTIFQQRFGSVSNGEVWYAEADTPAGPWGTAVRVLSHKNYTFYNPIAHPELTPADSSVLLFEGTYTAEFSNHPVPTARYNYNQILYRLDLDDPALQPAQVPAAAPSSAPSPAP